jgi:hypothetical protein
VYDRIQHPRLPVKTSFFRAGGCQCPSIPTQIYTDLRHLVLPSGKIKWIKYMCEILMIGDNCSLDSKTQFLGGHQSDLADLPDGWSIVAASSLDLYYSPNI